MSVAGASATTGAIQPPDRLPRLIQPDSPLNLAAHLDRYGPVPFGGLPGDSLITAAEQAGLLGRGGAGFPAARKMRAVVSARRRGSPLRSQAGAVLIANGAESEPASLKDRTLLHRAPHLVLDGIVLAAQAIGAGRAYLCVHAGEDRLAGQLRSAITDRERAGLNRVPIQVTAVPGGYVASQETALVSYLNGGSGKPTFIPPRPSDKGAHGRPTLVQNVETLAHLALIARYGPRWFAAVGGGQGSALVTVGGAVARPGVYEIELGQAAAELIRLAGGPSEPPQAILAGGFFGGWIPYQGALTLSVNDYALQAAGAAFGPGVFVVLPESSCGLAETARALGYLAAQSAGQCGPCSNGLPALADAFWELAFGRPDPDCRGWAARLLTLVAGRGACHLPDGAAALAGSAMRVFGAEIDRHAALGPCTRVGRSVLPVPGTAEGPS